MNTIDIIIAVILLFGFIRGLMKGFFAEAGSLVALFAAVYGAIHFSDDVRLWLQEQVEWETSVIKLVSFCITFVIILIGITLIGKLLTQIADFASLGVLNKIIGGIFGALKLGLILSIIFIFFGNINSAIPFVKDEVLEESILFKPVKNIAPMIFPSIIKGDKIELEEIKEELNIDNE